MKIVENNQQVAQGVNVGNDSLQREILSRMWEQLLVNTEPEEVPALIEIHGKPVMTPGNHSVMLGKKKARKTLTCTWLLSQLKGNHEDEIIIFDTEQGKKHLYKVYARLKKLTGANIKVYFLRGVSTQLRRQFITATLERDKGKVRLILIDGIRDLVRDINNATECTDLVEWMEQLIVDYGIHIANVLHCNKNDDNARGHLGTELVNKAETTILVRLSANKQYSVVSCEDSRDEPFDGFTIRHGDDGMPVVDWEIPKGKTKLSEEEKLERLRQCFASGLLGYDETIKKLQALFSVGNNAAITMLKAFKESGIVTVMGQARTKNVRYALTESMVMNDTRLQDDGGS